MSVGKGIRDLFPSGRSVEEQRFRPVGCRWLACLLLACAAVHAAEQPLPTEPQLDDQFRDAATTLAKRAREAAAAGLADLIAGWTLPPLDDRLVILALPDRLVDPAGLEAAAARSAWDDFVAARRRRAEGLFALAVEAARAHGRGPAFQPRGGDALRLLARTLRDDPDHERGRRAGGWVRRDGRWIWPEVARRLDKGEEFSAEFGWLPRGRQARYRAGERYDRGRWIPADDDARRPRTLDRAWSFSSDHWQIRATAGLDAAARLAADLETTHAIWLQAFGVFQFEAEDLERRFEGRGKPVVHEPFRCSLLADRAEYVAELEKLEPLIGKTLGIYWTPTHTSWFFVGPEQTPTTVHHEATHQLFAEMRTTSPLAGERCGFWAIEAAACFMESLAPTASGWTLGGRDAGRVPAARERLLEDGFYVPLEELTALGRQALQADERLPQIYSQIAGLADFFMTGERGRYREAFSEYLVRIYTGTVDPDTLARLCKRTYAELDEAYRRHLSR